MNYICEQTKQGSWRVSASNPARVIATLLDEDDARLIASAPELLEACKKALEEIKILENDCSGCTGTNTVSFIRAIITKAEGGK